jgi:diguanylate cyclase (GGDEF)-like protein
VPALITLLTVEFFALGVTVFVLRANHTFGDAWLTFGALSVGSVVHMELVHTIERVRERGRANTPHMDLKSVWTFAGLLLLPPALSLALVALTCLHQRVRLIRMQTFRWVYSSCAVLLATYAAMAVLDSALPPGDYPGLPSSWFGVSIIIAAAAIRWFVNTALIVAVILLTSPRTTGQEALGGFGNNLIEFAALSLGAITAMAVVHDVWYVFLLLPPLLVLHRSLMLSQYEEAARTDAKTGLANAVHWSEVARSELARAERDEKQAGVIMLDLDHFKKINDTYGHMTGDAVLTTVASALRKEARDYDLIGRFGGEEFMILLPDTDAEALPTIAERFRHCINGLIVISPDNHQSVTVTASAGAVGFPVGGSDLDELLLAADAALYRAKESGRNRTCMAPPVVTSDTAGDAAE